MLIKSIFIMITFLKIYKTKLGFLTSVLHYVFYKYKSKKLFKIFLNLLTKVINLGFADFQYFKKSY